MNSIYLSLILRLLNFLRTSDLFEVQRAAMIQRAKGALDPRLFAMIEFMVKIVDVAMTPDTGKPLSGTEKKREVVANLANSNPEIKELMATTPEPLVNEAIEFAVAKLRAA